MAPVTETSILTSYLSDSTALQSYLTLAQFSALFSPRDRHGKDKQIRSLYRDLQHQRMLLDRKIVANIQKEMPKAKQMRALVAEAKLNAKGPDVYQSTSATENSHGDELFHGFAGFPAETSSSSNDLAPRAHDLSSLNVALEDAASVLEGDLEQARNTSAYLLEEIQAITSGLSDLRYGKMSHPPIEDVVQNVVQGLQALQRTCANSEPS